MLRIIRFLFTGDWHLHEWEPYGVKTAIMSFDVPQYYQQSFKCRHCGEIKIQKV